MVLPLFYEDKTLYGSVTFIENKFLITAAHCFFNDDVPNPTRFTGKFYIGYQDKYVPLPEPLYDKYVPKAVTDKSCHVYTDIAIYRAPELLIETAKSYILGESDSLKFETTVEQIGYCDDTSLSLVKLEGQVINTVMATTNISEYDSIIRTFNNCFRVSNLICKNSSGGAIVYDGFCVGMIVFGTPEHINPPKETVALKASHIRSLLNKYN
jgi:hypothetical protein